MKVTRSLEKVLTLTCSNEITGYIEDNGCVDTLQWSMMPHSVLLQRFTINHSNLQGPHTGHHIQDDNTPPPPKLAFQDQPTVLLVGVRTRKLGIKVWNTMGLV